MHLLIFVSTLWDVRLFIVSQTTLGFQMPMFPWLKDFVNGNNKVMRNLWAVYARLRKNRKNIIIWSLLYFKYFYHFVWRGYLFRLGPPRWYGQQRVLLVCIFYPEMREQYKISLHYKAYTYIGMCIITKIAYRIICFIIILKQCMTQAFFFIKKNSFNLLTEFHLFGL